MTENDNNIETAPLDNDNPMVHDERVLARDANALERAKMAAQICADNRGRDIVILDLRKLSTAFDYFVIASGTSRRQLHAMSEEIDRVFEKDQGDKRMGIEGYRESRWILLDYGDIVVHLFVDEARDYFRLEDLWGAAEKVEFTPIQ